MKVPGLSAHVDVPDGAWFGAENTERRQEKDLTVPAAVEAFPASVQEGVEQGLVAVAGVLRTRASDGAAREVAGAHGGKIHDHETGVEIGRGTPGVRLFLVAGGRDDRAVKRENGERSEVRIDDQVAIQIKHPVDRWQKFRQEETRVNGAVGVLQSFGKRQAVEHLGVDEQVGERHARVSQREHPRESVTRLGQNAAIDDKHIDAGRAGQMAECATERRDETIDVILIGLKREMEDGRGHE